MIYYDVSFIEDIELQFSKWFWLRYGLDASRTSWHFFHWATRLKFRSHFDEVPNRIGATELARMFRQDCMKCVKFPTWRNAVRWYFFGSKGL